MVFVGLEVQVGCAQVDRVDQHLLQEADDGRILHLARCFLRVGLRRDVVGDIELEVARGERLHRLVRARRGAFEHLGEFVVLDDDPLGRKLGRELDPLGRFLIGWIGAADEDAIAALAENDDLILGRELAVDDVFRQLLRVHRIEVEERQGQRAGQRVREIRWRNRARRNDRGDKTGSLVARTADQLFGGLGVELAGVDQHPRDAGES